MNGLSAVFLMLASTASAVAPPIWDAHDRLLCQETFTLRCEIGNFQECERGELGLVVILDFKSNLVKERFLSDSDDEIIGRVYRPTIGTYADSIIITEHGDMITIYPETEGAPGNYHALRQSGFLRTSRSSFLTCLKDPSL
jgi:hypothetical protein